jgi:hypothetical protein
MAKNSRPSGNKRAREKAQAERHKEKASRRLERKERKASVGPRPEGEDPDLAGIVAGPQPRPEWLEGEEEEEASEDKDE